MVTIDKCRFCGGTEIETDRVKDVYCCFDSGDSTATIYADYCPTCKMIAEIYE